MAATRHTYNINIGFSGHVDSGKTSLVAALSTQLSTAALDKHPQSKERGITLDLGFSSFTTPVPESLQGLGCDELQFTLVDCPGHASLIKTIIGGAQIIDMMLLVIDITKGIQAQTAECLVVAEITMQQMLVVLNKVDLLPAAGRERSKLVAKAQKLLRQTFAHTKFASPPIVVVSAKPGGGEGMGPGAENMEALKEAILKMVPNQPREVHGPFLMAIDHCFAIKGQGTVLTGTVLQGSIKVNDTVEIPELRMQKKIKSMQMFKKPQQRCQQGDRVGICVTQLDPKLIERGLLAAPGTVPTFNAAVAAVEKIRFLAGEVRSKQKLHVTVGHVTVMAEIQYFGLPDGEGEPAAEAIQAISSRIGRLALKDSTAEFDFQRHYLYQEQLHGLEGRPSGEEGTRKHYGPQWALLRFSQPVTAPKDSLVIGSRLDDASAGAACRLALYGRITAILDGDSAADLARLQVYKVKQRTGRIERYLSTDGRSAVCRGFFKRESDFSAFIGMKVQTDTGALGHIEGAFGKSGKFRVQFQGGLPPLTADNSRLTLTFKRFIFDKDKRHMVQ